MRVVPHLGLEEIHNRYREARDGCSKVHWQVVRMAAEGQKAIKIAEAVGFTMAWVFGVVSRYNAQGPDALGDLRRNNQGRPPLLMPNQVEDLCRALEGPAPDGGLWNSTKVARWMSDLLGREVSPQRAWEYMVRSGFSLQKPRPKHAASDPEAQEDFKKKSSRRRSMLSGNPTRKPASRSGPKTSTASD